LRWLATFALRFTWLIPHTHPTDQATQVFVRALHDEKRKTATLGWQVPYSFLHMAQYGDLSEENQIKLAIRLCDRTIRTAVDACSFVRDQIKAGEKNIWRPQLSRELQEGKLFLWY